MRVHQCSICQAIYSTASHLRRHEAIHSGQRNFSCHFCNQRFFRVDVALRHSRSCPNKGNLPVRESLPRGKKRQACDTCACAKTACNRQRPCAGCKAHGLPCTYSRSESPNLPPPSIMQGQLSPEALERDPQRRSSDETYSQLSNADGEMKRIKKSSRVAVNFLLNFTDPSTDTIPHLFGTPAPTTEGPSVGPSSTTFHLDTDIDLSTQNDNYMFTVDMQEYLEELMHPYILHPFSEEWWCPTMQHQQTSSSEPHNPKLHARLAELISDLRKIENSLFGEEDQTSQELLGVPMTVENVQEFTRAYFDNWHGHCPILHRPSFNLETAYLPLILVVFLIGTVFSSPRANTSTSHQVYDLAEEYIFERKEFRQMLQMKRSVLQACPTSSIEVLQAAVLLAILQNWGGSVLSRRRMRIKRYSEVVSAGRLMGLVSAKNSFFHTTNQYAVPFNWNIFVQEEAQVRLMCYIYLVDCSFSVFYRHPPRLMVAEMSGDLPAREEVFSASDSAKCELLAIEHKNARPPSLASCLELLMHNDPEVAIDGPIGKVTTLNLFTIITGFLSVIFISRSNCIGSYVRPAIRRGLARWKKLWDAHLSDRDSTGFIKNAHEYWQLANILVEVESTKGIYSDRSQGYDLDSMQELNSLLQQFTI